MIGPPGVFTIETKSHPGPVRVGRVHGGVVEQARAQSRSVAAVTAMKVDPLLGLQQRLGGQADGAAQGRPGRARPDARAAPRSAGPTVLTREDIGRAHERLARALLDQQARERVASERRYLII